MCKIVIKRKPFPAVTGHTAESFNWMRSADLWQIYVTGDAIFRLTSERGNQLRRLLLARIQIPDQKEGQKN
jgi:hypothetical protein